MTSTDREWTDGEWVSDRVNETTGKNCRFVRTDNHDVCDLYITSRSKALIPFNNSIANAHLIAAAPDLYEALEAMLMEIDVMKDIATQAGNPKFFDGLQPEIDKAERAMSKARGVSS